MKLCERLKPDSVKYDLAEAQLNVLGYQLLGLKKTKGAMRIFRLKVNLFPEAFNRYDSLG